jgi:hypothetical protein
MDGLGVTLPINALIRTTGSGWKALVVRQVVFHRQNGMLTLNMGLWLELAFWEQEGVDAPEASSLDLGEHVRAACYATKPLGRFDHDGSRFPSDNFNRCLRINH